jgi:N-acetylneuraminic acid mutarotase
MPRVEHSYCREMCRGKEMMRTRFYLLLLFIVASLVVVPEVSAHEAVPVGTWTTTGSMATARYGHTATVLGSGAVLVVGGQSSAGQALATAELYDPTAGTWTTTGSMVTARYGHTATVLNDGRVLVTGGQDKAGHALGKAEIYDPASGTWTATRNMVFAHTFQTATLLNDGKVLVVGGQNERGSVIARAEIYDPASGTWTATSNMIFARMFQTATLLKDGRVLVAGGRDYNGSILTTAEIYDPTSGIWTATRNMNVARSFQTATLLNDGRVLVIGGGARLAEAYDPVAGTWATVGSMSVSRISHTATLLSNGTILVTGGQDNNSQALVTTEIYDPTKASWSLTGSMTAPRWGQTALLLGNGKVLVVGGQDNAGHALATAELFGFADTTAPTLQLPAPLNVNATNAQGATVNYSVTATDPDDTTSQITISCTPASGSVFPVGTTTVNCSAQDLAGNTSTGSFTVQVNVPDTTPPTLQLPAPITADATSPQGATVTYTVAATDPDNSADQVTTNCTPASGSVFPVGTTTVNCSAQDAAGNTSTGSFPVVVQDVTAPTLQLPTTITMNATSPQGATVNYAVSATDPTNTAAQIVITCTPLSGSVFPVGATTVDCSAQDPAGNTSTGSFRVIVQDVTAPTLQLPVTITADATSAQGVVVNYTTAATDPTNTPDQLTVNCTPPSGSVFPIGTTTVICDAQDPAGNTTTGSFPITVNPKTVTVNIDAL